MHDLLTYVPCYVQCFLLSTWNAPLKSTICSILIQCVGLHNYWSYMWGCAISLFPNCTDSVWKWPTLTPLCCGCFQLPLDDFPNVMTKAATLSTTDDTYSNEFAKYQQEKIDNAQQVWYHDSHTLSPATCQYHSLEGIGGNSHIQTEKGAHW